jgi:hypothetical protein
LAKAAALEIAAAEKRIPPFPSLPAASRAQPLLDSRKVLLYI